MDMFFRGGVRGQPSLQKVHLHNKDVLKTERIFLHAFLKSSAYRQQCCQSDSHFQGSVKLTKNAVLCMPGQ